MFSRLRFVFFFAPLFSACMCVCMRVLSQKHKNTLAVRRASDPECQTDGPPPPRWEGWEGCCPWIWKKETRCSESCGCRLPGGAPYGDVGRRDPSQGHPGWQQGSHVSVGKVWRWRTGPFGHRARGRVTEESSQQGLIIEEPEIIESGAGGGRPHPCGEEYRITGVSPSPGCLLGCT